MIDPSYIILLVTFVARVSTGALTIMAAPAVITAVVTCIRNVRNEDMTWRTPAQLLLLLQPFNLTLLLVGVLLGMTARLVGSVAFTILQVGYLRIGDQMAGDICVAVAWSLWALSSVSICAAFARHPMARFKGAGIMIGGVLLLLGYTGSFG